MVAPFVWVYGSKVDGRWVGESTRFCGVCLEETEHAILALDRRHHVYFVPFGKAHQVGRALRCEACKAVTPYMKHQGGQNPERIIDLFLDAHVLPIARADKSLWVGLAGMVIAALAIGLYVAFWQLADSAALSAFAYWLGALAALALTVVGYLTAQRLIGNHLLGRAAKSRLAKVHELTSWSVADVRRRAEERDLGRLAKFLASQE